MANIREADDTDLPAMLEIYNEVILNTTAVYHYDIQSPEIRKEWFEAKKSTGTPVWVAIENDIVIGFCTYGPFRPWPAYLHTVEHSLYLAPHARGKGIGHLLLETLILACRKSKYHTMIAGIDADNTPSIALHQRMGFETVGQFKQVGYKFNRWLDLIFMQLIL